MMHLSICGPGQAVKEAIVPVAARHVACTYDTEWEKSFPLLLWNVFESVEEEKFCFCNTNNTPLAPLTML